MADESYSGTRAAPSSASRESGVPTTWSEFFFVQPGDEHLQQAARRAAGTLKPVVILGEPGTGRSTLARFIHQQSARERGPFRTFHCDSQPSEKLAAELFGRRHDPYSGLAGDAPGAIDGAEGGTLLLCNFEGAARHLEAQLLSWLDTNQVQPQGSATSRSVNVRLIIAADPELKEHLSKGLWRRLTEWPPVHMTPLRVQRRKKWLFFKRYVEQAATQANMGVPSVVDFLLYFFVIGFEWPGNGGQLRYFAEYLVQSGFLKEGALRMDGEFRFFDASDPLSVPTPFGQQARSGASTVPARLVAAPGEQFFRNRVHWDYHRIVHLLQTSEHALTWRDLAKASPDPSGTWTYPQLRWTDPYFESQEACARAGQEFSTTLIRVLEDDRQLPQAPLYRPQQIPWKVDGEVSYVAAGRSTAELARMLAFGLVSGAIPDRDDFALRVFAAMVDQAPGRSRSEYEALGIPGPILDQLLS